MNSNHRNISASPPASLTLSHSNTMIAPPHGNNIHHPLHPLHSDIDTRSDIERESDRRIYMQRMQELWESELEDINTIDFSVFLQKTKVKKV